MVITMVMPSGTERHPYFDNFSAPGYNIVEHNTFVCVTPQESSNRRSRSCQSKIALRPHTLGSSEEALVELASKLDARSPEHGLTLMWHDVPLRSQADDLVDTLTSLGCIDDVQYIYVPVQSFTQNRKINPRNKGYAFVHFSSALSAWSFVRELESAPRPMRTSEAKFQGVAENVLALLSMPDIPGRTDKIFFLHRADDNFVRVSLYELRSFLRSQKHGHGY